MISWSISVIKNTLKADSVPSHSVLIGDRLPFLNLKYHTVTYTHIPYNIFPLPMGGVPCLFCPHS